MGEKGLPTHNVSLNDNIAALVTELQTLNAALVTLNGHMVTMNTKMDEMKTKQDTTNSTLAGGITVSIG